MIHNCRACILHKCIIIGHACSVEDKTHLVPRQDQNSTTNAQIMRIAQSFVGFKIHIFQFPRDLSNFDWLLRVFIYKWIFHEFSHNIIKLLMGSPLDEEFQAIASRKMTPYLYPSRHIWLTWDRAYLEYASLRRLLVQTKRLAYPHSNNVAHFIEQPKFVLYDACGCQ